MLKKGTLDSERRFSVEVTTVLIQTKRRTQKVEWVGGGSRSTFYIDVQNFRVIHLHSLRNR